MTLTPDLSVSPPQARQRRAVLLCGLALLAFVLRVWRLDYQSLWRDEVDAVIFATRSLPDVMAMFTRVGDNGPLYFLGLHGWIGLVGQSEFAIRFPSACCGVLAVLATYRLGKDVAGDAVGMIGALLLTVSPYHIWYGQEAKMYSAVSLLAPLSLIILLRALRGERRWLWPAWAIVMAAFLYVHLFALMMALVAAAWTALLLQRRPRPTPVLLAALAIALLAALPVARWLIPAALTPVETGYYRYGLGEMAAILLNNFSMGLRPAGGVWPLALYVALLALGCVPLFRYPSEGSATFGRVSGARGTLLLLTYLVVPLLAIWLVSLRRPTFTDRYLIITLPAFFLLLAQGCVIAGRLAETWALRMSAPGRSAPSPSSMRQRRLAAARVGLQRQAALQEETAPVAAPLRHDLARWATTGLVLLVVLASLPFVWAQTHNAYKADFRAAARYISEHEQTDDVFIFLMPYVQRSFGYYHPQAVRSVEPPYTRDMSAAEVDARLRNLVGADRRVWLFLSEQDFWDAPGLIVPWFERNGLQRCQEEFAYIEVRCYDMK
jgi:4-amino-4-deoxy-L-arabinose transferase-like glycosyltransferase